MSLNQRLLLSAVLLLLLTHFCRGQYTMIAPSQPIIAAVGSTVVLSCQLDPTKDLGNMAVEWARPDLEPWYVHIRRDGAEFLIDQNSLYLGRTALSDMKLKYGDMSLELSRVRLSDNGTYRCYVPQMDKRAEVTLLVVSVSSPSVSLTKDHSGSPVLKCESRGWYPEPELVWLDSEGNVLSAGRTEPLSVNEELFTVKSRLTVEQSHGTTFTCRVSQDKTKQTRETHIDITDEFLEVPSCSVSWTLFSLGLCLIIAAAAAFVLWKFKFSRTKAVNKDNDLGETGESERMIQTTSQPQVKVKSLDLKSSGHSEDLERIEEDLQYVEDMINKLTENKDTLMNLKAKQTPFIYLLNTLIEEEKKRSIGMLRRDTKMEEKNKRIKELEKQKEECEEMIKNIDNQMKTTEEMILDATKRKGRLERDKEQVTKSLKQEKKPQEAVAQPETQQLLVEDEERVHIQDETVTAQDQTEEAQSERKQEKEQGSTAEDESEAKNNVGLSKEKSN